MSFYLCVYIWFLRMYPMEQIGVSAAESLLIVISAWIGFPVLQTLVFLILPLGLKILKPENIFAVPITAGCLYVLLEWVQSWFLSGLSWAALAVSQYRNLFFIQSMSVFGTYFPAFIIIFINSALAVFFLNRKNKTAKKLIFACVLLYSANLCFGFLRVYFYSGDYETITAQTVQGNISSYEKWEERGILSSLEIYGELTGEYSGSKVDICVWPETAVPAAVMPGGGLYGSLQGIAEDNGITLFAGTFYSEIIEGEQKNYNAITVFGEDLGFVQPYAKRHLVPFGEYLPLENVLTAVFPFIANISLFSSQLTPGDSPNVMYIDGIGYGGLVCFDSIFPELARESVKNGADILIIVTNDSWFRDSSAIYQHNAQAVLRAVQNNRYIIRAANTGISSFISPTGKILQESKVFERTVLTQEAGIIKNKTLYTRLGELMLYLAAGYFAVCSVNKGYNIYKKKRGRSL